MRHKIILLLISVFCVSEACSQILEKMISKFENLENLSYSAAETNKDIFGDDFYYDTTIQAEFDFSDNRKLYRVIGQKYGEWNDGNKLVRFDLSEKTFNNYDPLKLSDSEYNSLPNKMISLAKNLQKNMPIQQLEDSLVNDRAYYHVEIVTYDTIINDRRAYTIKKLLIDKNTYLPLIYREYGSGFINGTDIYINAFTEYCFTNIKLNVGTFDDLSQIVIPEDFSKEIPRTVLPMLDKGVEAPELDLLGPDGEPYLLKSKKGKIVLLNFSLVGCPHCIKSTEMLNEYYSTLDSKDFEIVSIYPKDSEESVRKENEKFGVLYPAYKNTENVKVNIENYRINGYPKFYLIDKEGRVIKGVPGYSPSIREELTKLINEHL